MIHSVALQKPRLAFVGTGWIGRARMEACSRAGAAHVAVVCDEDLEVAEKAAAEVGCDTVCRSLDEVLAHPVDGVVLATPSALHAEQSLRTLERGIPVFCQKPLARDADETKTVVDAARERNLLLDVDLSYRYVEAFRRAFDLATGGELGRVYAGEFVFHNAYGPDKPWFTERSLSGGGCLIDLGTHLVDLALWIMGDCEAADGRLFSQGRPLEDVGDAVEDFAECRLDMTAGATARIACSWFLSAGRDAVIEMRLHGTEAGLSVHNVGGSFYDFTCEVFRGRSREVLVRPPDDWGGRALIAWAQRVAAGTGPGAETDQILAVAKVVDSLYGRTP